LTQNLPFLDDRPLSPLWAVHVKPDSLETHSFKDFYSKAAKLTDDNEEERQYCDAYKQWLEKCFD